MSDNQNPEKNVSSEDKDSKKKEMIAKKLAEKCLDYFHDSMNSEISRLWQRSIFLAALLGLVFAGYGNTLLKFFDSACFCGTGISADSALNFVCVGISFFGVLFSALWIMMMKGSKAWQEKYEHTLFRFIDDYVKKTKEASRECSNDELVVFSKYGFAHGYLKALEKGKFSNSLIKFEGGAYSVSKINIVLGIISLSFWMVAGVVHSLFVPSEFWSKAWSLLCEFIQSQFWTPTVFVAVSAIVVRILSRKCKSTVIQEKQDSPEE